jgi:hypothetical protein
MGQETEKKVRKAKAGGMVGIQDPKDELKDSLDYIISRWEELNMPAKYDNSTVTVAIVKAYAEELKRKEPTKLNTKQLFEIRE